MTVPVYPTTPHPTFPVGRSPIWDTVKEESIGGKRARYPNRNLPMYRYELDYEYLYSVTPFQWQIFLGFYNSVNGASGLFAFNDIDDSVATTEPFGTGDGTSTVFQLTRAGQFGFAEPVFNPVTITQVRINAVATSAYTADLTTGLITFTSAPAAAAALDWTGTFNWYCRFDDDVMGISKFMTTLFEAKKVVFTTELL